MAISAETFFIELGGESTLQQQIQRCVILAILAGRFRPGERMPSSRRLATHLGISRITVTLAYTELVSNDYLSARGRSGYFISETAPQTPRFDLPDMKGDDAVDWQRSIGQSFSHQASILRPPDWRSYRYPFIYGQADERLFDHQNWRLCALQALGQKDFVALTSDYYDRDDPGLIEYIARHILPRRGITARPEQILLTLGAQNALWLCAQVLLTQRRTAAMENPGYGGLRDILGQTRCSTRFVDVDRDGLPPDTIPSDVDVVFTTPSHHSPTNVTMPLARRTALLERADQHDFIVVENDYESEMSFLTSPSPALKSLDQRGRVIYIGSFSKSLFPGLRLGYLVGSEPFIREARALRALVLRHPPGHIQRTVLYFLSLGHYDTQMSRTARAYKRRRAVLNAAIEEHGLNIASPGVAGGSSIWMQAPGGVNTGQLATDLRQQQVIIEPGHAFFEPEANNFAHYRLAYSSIPAERIAEGVARIARALL